MKHLKRYAALCMALVVACSAMAVPASATDYQSTYNFWNWAYDNSWFLGKAIIGFSAGNVCQVSEDGLHHATTHSGGGGSVDGQRVYNCVCDLCGQEFQAVATDLEYTYDYEVQNNGYTYIDNDGYYVAGKWVCDVVPVDGVSIALKYDDAITVTIDDFICDAYFYCVWNGKAYNNNATWRYYFTPDEDGELYYDNRVKYTTGLSNPEVTKYSATYISLYGYTNGADADPVFIASTGGTNTDLDTYHSSLTAGVQYYIELLQPIKKVNSSGDYFVVELPWAKYKPDNPVTFNDRPFSFTPSFTYEDGDGWQVHVGLDGNKLIDETNLTYYNPVTNTTTNIQNWSYDYSDRSYTVLTDSNNTITITYGDEYITINEGDNITYNIYYYTAPDSSGDGDSSGSDGSGDDDGGGLLDKIGELIGTVLGGFIDVIGAALGKVIDSLIDLVTLTIDKLVNVINLFGSFGDALGVLWSWLPEEVVTVLVSGVTVIVFASVIKLFMR